MARKKSWTSDVMVINKSVLITRLMTSGMPADNDENNNNNWWQVLVASTWGKSLVCVCFRRTVVIFVFVFVVVLVIVLDWKVTAGQSRSKQIMCPKLSVTFGPLTCHNSRDTKGRQICLLHRKKSIGDFWERFKLKGSVLKKPYYLKLYKKYLIQVLVFVFPIVIPN